MTDSLFDFDDLGGDPCVTNDEGGGQATASSQEWHEVPQARFMSWPLAQQLAYCAARDIDSAAEADTLEEIEFFQQRARMYQAMK